MYAFGAVIVRADRADLCRAVFDSSSRARDLEEQSRLLAEQRRQFEEERKKFESVNHSPVDVLRIFWAVRSPATHDNDLTRLFPSTFRDIGCSRQRQKLRAALRQRPSFDRSHPPSFPSSIICPRVVSTSRQAV